MNYRLYQDMCRVTKQCQVPDGRTALYATACRANHSCLRRAQPHDSFLKLGVALGVRNGDPVKTTIMCCNYGDTRKGTPNFGKSL